MKIPAIMAPEALDFSQLIRAGETIGWAEATAEPVFLTRLVCAAAGREGVGGAPSKGTILVVEDNVDVAELTMDMLERGGYTVQLVDHAAAALSVLGSKQPIDLVFSDVIMPGGINGIALAEEIRRSSPGLPVLLASGYAEAAKDAEAKGLIILRKPYRPADLVDGIERMLQLRSLC